MALDRDVFDLELEARRLKEAQALGESADIRPDEKPSAWTRRIRKAAR